MKADYGLDAPRVVTSLIIFGVVSILASRWLSALTHGTPVLWLVFFLWGVVAALFLFVTAGLMIRSSKSGKYLTREIVFDLLNLQGNEKVLDVGCGRGLFLNGIAKRLPQGAATGIDIWNQSDQSGNNMDAALKNAEIEGVSERVSVQTADMRHLPFADESFNVVVSNLAIHNLRDDSDRVQAIHEIVRVLPEGGKIAIMDFQHIQEYAIALKEAGVYEVQVIAKGFRIFPPVKLILATK